jgi:acyl CoA:acetate/3-ketoacid CoA transferase beta subunit
MLPALQRTQIDQIVASMAALIEDGDFLAEGIGTFLPTSAYMLAKLTHAPNCMSLCPNGNTLMPGTRTLTLGQDEFETIPRAALWLDYVTINLVYMPTIFVGGKPRWTEFMRPAQIDAYGATNNVCIGPYERPRVRLPGAAGIPDATPVARRVYYYVPRHTRQVFVPALDFCSGAGHPRPGADGQARTITVVTDLCVLSTSAGGKLRIDSLHPGVTQDEVHANTGFELERVDAPPVSTPLSDTQRELLERVVDPLGLRYLEALAGAARRDKLRELAAREPTS